MYMRIKLKSREMSIVNLYPQVSADKTYNG